MIGIVSFGSGSRAWIRAGKRLKKQLKPLGSVDFVCEVYSSIKDLNMNQNDLHFSEKNPKGLGYWIWKPHVILKMLEEYPTVDQLIYMDAGCDISGSVSTTKVRMLLSEMLDKDAIVFNMPNIAECQFTKSTLGAYLNASMSAMESPQICATVFCLRREFAIDFCKQWIDVMRARNYEFLIDDPIPTGDNFIAHRHDQSIFSLLMKQKADDRIIVKELSYFENQESFLNIARNRSSRQASDQTVLSIAIKVFEKLVDRFDRYTKKVTNTTFPHRKSS